MTDPAEPPFPCGCRMIEREAELCDWHWRAALALVNLKARERERQMRAAHQREIEEFSGVIARMT